MGEAELIRSSSQLLIHSSIVLYGDEASHELAAQVATAIGDHWNEPQGNTTIKGTTYRVSFRIEGKFEPNLDPEKVWYNDNPRLNFFRVESFAISDISFVDGLNCNTGYFKLANLLQTSTTAAHEYGHTLGLDHPHNLDIRGQATPGIMYPRGTICDPAFQYDPQAQPGKPGGTLDPRHRRVLQSDIDLLKLHRLSFNQQGLATVGDFSSLYHQKHQPTDAQQ